MRPGVALAVHEQSSIFTGRRGRPSSPPAPKGRPVKRFGASLRPVAAWAEGSGTETVRFALMTSSSTQEKTTIGGPGRVARLVRRLSRYTKVVGLIPGQGPCRNQPMNASMSGIMNQCFFLLSALSKINKQTLKKKEGLYPWSSPGRCLPCGLYYHR